MSPPLERSSNQRLRAGFTLVEIAIVLVIIGLIIGGVMVGADLIAVAQVRSQIAQIERYNTATHAFQLQYNALPGDLAANLASQYGFIPANRAGTFGKGNGDGVLESSFWPPEVDPIGWTKKRPFLDGAAG